MKETCAVGSALLNTQNLNTNETWEWKQGYTITNRLWVYIPQFSFFLNIEMFPIMWRNFSGRNIEFLLNIPSGLLVQTGGFVSNLRQEATAADVCFLPS